MEVSCKLVRNFMKLLRLILALCFIVETKAASPTFDTMTATTVTATTTLNAPSSFTLAVGKVTGLSTVGTNLITLTNPSAISFIRLNANNTADALSAVNFRTAIGAGTGNGTVTAVSVASANGISGSSSGGATPALTLALGDITPSSVFSADISAISLGLLNSNNPAFRLNFLSEDSPTATRTLSISLSNGNRTLTIPASATISGTNTGDQTIALTGDVTGTGTGSFATTLANSGVTAATYGSATQAPSITLNAKGLATAASNVTITPAVGSITGLGTSVATALGNAVNTAGGFPKLGITGGDLLLGFASQQGFLKIGDGQATPHSIAIQTLGTIAANRDLRIFVDASRDVSISGNLTFAGAFTTGGNMTFSGDAMLLNGFTYTFPGATKTLLATDGNGSALTAITAANITASTTVGLNLLNATNPSAITFPKVAADNTVSFRTPAQVLSDIGAQASGSYAASGANSDITGLSAVTTVGGSGVTTVFPGPNTHNKSGAASVPAIAFSGVPFAGTGTTSFPLVFINDANATASTTLNTAGTYFGINIDGTQDGINVLKDGTSVFKVNSSGGFTAAGDSLCSGYLSAFIHADNGGGTARLGAAGGAQITATAALITNTVATQLNSTLAVTGTSTLTGAVGVGGTANANAILDAQSTTKAFMPPRMTTTQKNAIASPTEGMEVYDTTLHKKSVYTGTVWETVTSL